jgi:multidrug efflux pump subunit AcrB
MRRTLLLLVALPLTPAGCLRSSGDGPVIVVTASYPGANAQTVADTVAAPIEQQIVGVEGMVWLESESRNDGSYVAWLRFERGTDPNMAQVLVQNRVALAMPTLPAEVQRGDIAVKRGAARDGMDTVVIALTDRGDHGAAALREWSDVVTERLKSDGALVKPEVFPGPDEKQLDVQIDRDKCARLGVAVGDVAEAVRKAGPGAKAEELKEQKVPLSGGGEVPLEAVASFREFTGPAAVYRVNLYPAVRITGSAPEGKSAAAAARRCVELAEAERKKGDSPHGFAVEDLTAR